MSNTTDERWHRAAALSAPPRPRVPRPIVVLGAGGIVRAAHLPAYEKAGFPVIALADRMPGLAGSIAAEHNVPHAFDSVSQAVRFAPGDAVFDIAVPASQILALLQQLPRGAAVLIQKPMGATIAEARAILNLCSQRELIAAVNFQLRFAPAHLAAVALANEGLLGTLHDVEVQVRTYTPWHLWSFLSTAPWLEILYHSIHYLDLLRAWLGTPRSVYAKASRHPLHPQLAATRTSIILDYGDMHRVSIITNHAHEFASESQLSFVQWEGTAGAMRMSMGVNLDYPKGKPDTLSFAHRGGTPWQEVAVSGNWFPDAFMGSMGSLQAFAEGTTGELPTSVESAFETMALVEAAYASSDRGGEVIHLDR